MRLVRTGGDRREVAHCLRVDHEPARGCFFDDPPGELLQLLGRVGNVEDAAQGAGAGRLEKVERDRAKHVARACRPERVAARSGRVGQQVMGDLFDVADPKVLVLADVGERVVLMGAVFARKEVELVDSLPGRCPIAGGPLVALALDVEGDQAARPVEAVGDHQSLRLARAWRGGDDHVLALPGAVEHQEAAAELTHHDACRAHQAGRADLTAARPARVAVQLLASARCQNHCHRHQERQHAGGAGAVDVVLKPGMRAVPVPVLVEGQRRHVLRLHGARQAGEDQARHLQGRQHEDRQSGQQKERLSPAGNACRRGHSESP